MAADEQAPLPDSIKIDTEGYELDIMRGMEGILAREELKVLGVEVHFPRLNERGLDNAAGEIERFLKSSCFKVSRPDAPHIFAHLRRAWQVMSPVTLRNTDLSVSRLAFGTSRLHHLRSAAERVGLLEEACAQGFTHFDTSPYYGYGIGEWGLGQLPEVRRGGITVATKVGMYSPLGVTRSIAGLYLRKLAGKTVRPLSCAAIDWSLKRAKASLDGSLKRLRRDHVDILFLHEPTPGLIPADEYRAWLEDEQKTGRVRYWGVSGNHRQFAEWADDHPLTTIRQVRYEGGSIQPGPQILFGSIDRMKAINDETVSQAIRDVLQQHDGCLLVSTRQRERLKVLATAAGRHMKVIDSHAESVGEAALKCDVCVVGAGAAGIYLATQLVETGLSVVLLEAGPPDLHGWLYGRYRSRVERLGVSGIDRWTFFRSGWLHVALGRGPDLPH